MKQYFVITLLIISLVFFEKYNAAGQDKDAAEVAEIYVYRPTDKNENSFTVFFNRAKVFSIENGARTVYKIASEGSLTIVCIEGSAYQEPSSKAKNTRTITIEKGKSYYFEITKKAEIVYSPNATLGKATFGDDSKFNSSPREVKEDPRNPIPSLSIDKNIIRFEALVKKTKQDIAKKEKEIKKKLEDYFNELKKQAKLAESVSPNVSVTVNEDGMYGGRMRYSLRASYSYEVDESGVNAEIMHYPPGSYQLPTSPAAVATTEMVTETIKEYLSEYFEPGSKVNIRITGSTDSSPIRNSYYYQGEYGLIQGEDFYKISGFGNIGTPGVLQIDSTKLEVKNPKDKTADVGSDRDYESINPFSESSPKLSISFKQGERITKNEQLAFLRSRGILNYLKNMRELQKTKNNITLRGAIGGQGSKFRKVVIELAIQDIFRNK